MLANVLPSIRTVSSVSTDTNYHIGDFLSGGTYITPPQIATAYNIPASTGAGVKIGIVSLGGGWLQSDLNKSMADLGLPNPTITNVLMPGTSGTFSTTDNNASVENTLDLYCVAGMVPSANIVMYTSDVATLQDYIDVFNRAINEGCDVITHSWSVSESSGYGDFLQTSLANAAEQGISVFVATGDYGSQDGSGSFGVNYPASSANVIAVGGTILTLNSDNSRKTETADPNSSGGISSLIARPSWQNGLTYRTYNSVTQVTSAPITLPRRGIPDISAPMENYLMYFNGNIVAIGGTSASAPVMAGMMARFISINGRRPVPKSLNPIFYKNINAFSDLTTGNDTSYLSTGYAVTSSWDPVVGLGTPNGTNVYQIETSGGTAIKDNTGTWKPVSNVKVKTDTNTWSNVKAIWTKVNSTTWKQTF